MVTIYLGLHALLAQWHAALASLPQPVRPALMDSTSQRIRQLANSVQPIAYCAALLRVANAIRGSIQAAKTACNVKSVVIAPTVLYKIAQQRQVACLLQSY